MKERKPHEEGDDKPMNHRDAEPQSTPQALSRKNAQEAQKNASNPRAEIFLPLFFCQTRLGGFEGLGDRVGHKKAQKAQNPRPVFLRLLRFFAATQFVAWSRGEVGGEVGKSNPNPLGRKMGSERCLQSQTGNFSASIFLPNGLGSREGAKARSNPAFFAVFAASRETCLGLGAAVASFQGDWPMDSERPGLAGRQSLGRRASAVNLTLQ